MLWTLASLLALCAMLIAADRATPRVRLLGPAAPPTPAPRPRSRLPPGGRGRVGFLADAGGDLARGG
jgi:hypothetical protein